MKPYQQKRSAARLMVLSIMWALAMMTSAAINLTFQSRVLEAKSGLLVAFFGLGAGLAFPLGIFMLRLVPNHWLRGQKFSAAFICLSLLTIGVTAMIFGLHFRIYFAQWHDDHFSVRLMFETVFTILSAVYQFLVLGLRLYLPLGLIALLGASLAFATKRI
jgi:hypothetical protein